jgi:hypothetical protein
MFWCVVEIDTSSCVDPAHSRSAALAYIVGWGRVVLIYIIYFYDAIFISLLVGGVETGGVI